MPAGLITEMADLYFSRCSGVFIMNPPLDLILSMKTFLIRRTIS